MGFTHIRPPMGGKPARVDRCRCVVGTCPYGGPHGRTLTRKRKNAQGEVKELVLMPEQQALVDNLPIMTMGTGKNQEALLKKAQEAGVAFTKANAPEAVKEIFPPQEKEAIAHGAQGDLTGKDLGVVPFVFGEETQEKLRDLRNLLDAEHENHQGQLIDNLRNNWRDTFRINSKITPEHRQFHKTLMEVGSSLDNIVTDEAVFTPQELREREVFLGEVKEESNEVQSRLDALLERKAEFDAELEAADKGRDNAMLLRDYAMSEDMREEARKKMEAKVPEQYHGLTQQELKGESDRQDRLYTKQYNEAVGRWNANARERERAMRELNTIQQEAEKEYNRKFHWKKRSAYVQALKDLGVKFPEREAVDAYANHEDNRFSTENHKSLVKESLSLYPQSLVEGYMENPTETTFSHRRAYHQQLKGERQGRKTWVTHLSMGDDQTTTLHEVTHGMEANNSSLAQAEATFLRLEADAEWGKKVERIPLGASSGETSITHRLLTDYSGKTYKDSFYARGKSFEVLSTGLPALMYGDRGGFEGLIRGREAKSHKHFTLATLVLFGRR